MPSPARRPPAAAAACSSARATVVPMRDDAAAARSCAARIAATVDCRQAIGLVERQSRIERGSPVDDRPAAWVRVAKPTPRRRKASSSCQSSTKPADGGSNATGSAGDRVHTSQSASGAARCAYWTGRPWRAMPAQIASASPAKRSSTRRGWPSDAHARSARERPERERVAGRERRRRGRSSVRRAVVARAEDDGAKALRRRRRERAPARQAHLDRRAARQVPPGEARGQGRGVVGDHAGRRREQRRQSALRGCVLQAPAGIDDEQLRVARPLHRQGWRPSCARLARGRRGALAVDRADDLAGRVARPLQRRRVGVGHRERRAAACPCRRGRRRRRRCRAAASSSSQMRLRCASAALLAP